VSEVEGVIDPMDARLVIHGWFVQPRPYVIGGLSVTQVEKVLSRQLSESENYFKEMGLVHGTVSLRLFVNASGKITSSKVLTNNVQGLQDPFGQKEFFNSWLKIFVKDLAFPKAKKPSAITLPLIFE
jgi:hypothetical protein